jgi:hypothetical protein
MPTTAHVRPEWLAGPGYQPGTPSADRLEVGHHRSYLAHGQAACPLPHNSPRRPAPILKHKLDARNLSGFGEPAGATDFGFLSSTAFHSFPL